MPGLAASPPDPPSPEKRILSHFVTQWCTVVSYVGQCDTVLTVIVGRRIVLTMGGGIPAHHRLNVLRRTAAPNLTNEVFIMTKKIKGNAATTSAPKKVQPRAEFVDLANAITEKTQSLNSVLYDGAFLCRKLKATPEELELVLDAAPRQRRNEFKTVVTAPSGAITASAPKSLGKLAQFIKARNKGASAAIAKQFAEQKLDAAGLAEKLGQEPPKKAGKKDKGAQSRNDEANPWELLKAAMAAFEKQYGDDCPDVEELFNDFYDGLKAATAEADDVELGEAV